MNIADQTMVVIGGTSGVGLATARAAAEAGARVVIAGRDRGRLEAALKSFGDKVSGDAVDVSDRAALETFLEAIGSFDHLVIAASGGAGAGPFPSLTRRDVQTGFDSKFWVQWSCAQAALPYLQKTGSMTFVTAASSRVGNPNTSGLAAVNGALAAMVLPLAHELAPVRVNAVSPGVIDTPWWDKQPASIREQFFERTAATVPAGRIGSADEVADAIMFLAGNAYVTGIVLDVDGGLRGTQPS